MNLQQANFEDLLATYYNGTAAHEALESLMSMIRSGEDASLAELLRDYRIRPVYLAVEIKTRAAIDRLMNCCSVMEICSLAGFVAEIRKTSIGSELLEILQDKHLRRYYEEFYPTMLPQLFRARLAGVNCVVEAADDLNRTILAFLNLDRQFMNDLDNDDGVLLRMLDSFTIEGCRFGDVIELIKEPERFIGCLLAAPQNQDVRSRALNEFSLLMQFCFDLLRLLTQTASQPLLQSAIWNHYSYWFDIIGSKLREQRGEALSKFLAWKPRGSNEDAGLAAQREAQTYVSEARAVLEVLTSRTFAQPVEALLAKVDGR